MKPESVKSGDQDVAIRFDVLIRKVLSVPDEVILQREAEYRRQSGPKAIKSGPGPMYQQVQNHSLAGDC